MHDLQFVSFNMQFVLRQSIHNEGYLLKQKKTEIMIKLDLKNGIKMMVLGLSFSIGSLFAQVPGEIDHAWAFSGWLGTDHINNKGEIFSDMIMLDNDAFLMVGYTTGANMDMLLAKYNSDGTLDEDFGNAGIAIIDVSLGLNDAAFTATVLWDNKIILAGSTTTMTSIEMVLIRLEENGEMDYSFGTSGIVRYTAGNGTWSSPAVIDILLDNSILVGASIYDGSVWNINILKFNQLGALDVSFGDNGVALLSGVMSNDEVKAMAVNDDGDIYVLGVADFGATEISLIAKFDNTGNLDLDFNTTGIVDYQGAFPTSIFSDMKIGANGKIVVVGYEGENDNYNGMIFCYNEDGTLDASFGTAGKLTLDIGTTNGIFLYKLEMIQDGKMLASGNASGQTLDQIYAFMFNSNGSSDCAFSSCGGVYIDYTNQPSDYICNLLGVMSDGSILLGGHLSSQDIVGENMSIVKVFNTNQSLGFSDNELNEAIITVYPNPTSSSFQIQLNQDEYIMNANLIGMDGRIAQEWNGETSIYHLNDAVASGRYWLNVQTNQTSYKNNLIINK